MNDKLDELAKSMAQSVSRREALRWFGLASPLQEPGRRSSVRSGMCALGSVSEQKGESPFMAALPAIN